MLTVLLAIVAAVVTPIAFLVATSYIYFCINVAQYRHLPGPKASWPGGNAKLLLDPNTGTRRELSTVHAELQRRYGDVCVFFMGCTPVVLVSGAPWSI